VESPGLDISTEPLVHGWVRLCLRGDLDLNAATQFRQRLTDELDAGDGVLLDIAGVDFIDSTGLGLIVAGLRHAEAVGARLEFAQPLPVQARRLLEMSGLLPRLVLRSP
jgi:stage II sporulation protein AA (anti-sigma F factor antagonist)